ncbi:uncharacterized protein LOC105701152 [Orussus abietinus]|uniref:uncharacterized protein LOC105701152 n=1 Tax=Orussus abietinus TaxID=222816 RepID=UPI000625A37A|nr:uncharacterized protein LOC105701152 [Orussus abietinus]
MRDNVENRRDHSLLCLATIYAVHAVLLHVILPSQVPVTKVSFEMDVEGFVPKFGDPGGSDAGHRDEFVERPRRTVYHERTNFSNLEGVVRVVIPAATEPRLSLNRAASRDPRKPPTWLGKDVGKDEQLTKEDVERRRSYVEANPAHSAGLAEDARGRSGAAASRPRDSRDVSESGAVFRILVPLSCKNSTTDRVTFTTLTARLASNETKIAEARIRVAAKSKSSQWIVIVHFVDARKNKSSNKGQHLRCKVVHTIEQSPNRILLDLNSSVSACVVDIRQTTAIAHMCQIAAQNSSPQAELLQSIFSQEREYCSTCAYVYLYFHGKIVDVNNVSSSKPSNVDFGTGHSSATTTAKGMNPAAWGIFLGCLVFLLTFTDHEKTKISLDQCKSNS